MCRGLRIETCPLPPEYLRESSGPDCRSKRREANPKTILFYFFLNGYFINKKTCVLQILTGLIMIVDYSLMYLQIFRRTARFDF